MAGLLLHHTLANVAVVARVQHTRRAGEADAVVEGLNHGREEEGEEEEDAAADGDEKAVLWDVTPECRRATGRSAALVGGSRAARPPRRP